MPHITPSALAKRSRQLRRTRLHQNKPCSVPASAPLFIESGSRLSISEVGKSAWQSSRHDAVILTLNLTSYSSIPIPRGRPIQEASRPARAQPQGPRASTQAFERQRSSGVHCHVSTLHTIVVLQTSSVSTDVTRYLPFFHQSRIRRREVWGRQRRQIPPASSFRPL